MAQESAVFTLGRRKRRGMSSSSSRNYVVKVLAVDRRAVNKLRYGLNLISSFICEDIASEIVCLNTIMTKRSIILNHMTTSSPESHDIKLNHKTTSSPVTLPEIPKIVQT